MVGNQALGTSLGEADTGADLGGSIKTPKSWQIIKKAERQLLNDINQNLSLCDLERDTCYNKLKDLLDRETPQES